MDLIEFRPLKKENPMGEARKEAFNMGNVSLKYEEITRYNAN
jgi:hypothetical protein